MNPSTRPVYPRGSLPELFDRLPPADPEAEKRVLGGLLLDATGEVTREVRDMLRPDDFTVHPHARLFSTILELAAHGPVDLTDLRSHLILRGQFDALEGEAMLADVAAAAITSGQARSSANVVRTISVRRKVIEHAHNQLLGAYGAADAATLQEMAENHVAHLKRESVRDTTSLLQLEPITCLREEEPIDWLIPGILARGHSTILTAHPKAGKTTLLSHWLRGEGIGGTLPRLKCPILVITEESRAVWRARRENLDIHRDEVVLSVRPFKGRPTMDEWCTTIREAIREVIHRDIGCIVFDTICKLLPVEDENNATQMDSALLPLYGLMDAGAGLLMLHHERKSGGEDGVAIRGSSALAGFADILVSLRRGEGGSASRRILQGVGRPEGVLAEQVIELVDGVYNVVGTVAESDRESRIAVVRDILPDQGEGWTIETVLEYWPSNGIPKPSARTLQRDLSQVITGIERLGRGVSGDSYRFRVLSRTPPLLRARHDMTSMNPPVVAPPTASTSPQQTEPGPKENAIWKG